MILPGSRRGSAEDRRGRCRAAGVVVELSILPVALRRAAEDVVELRGRRRGVALSAVVRRAAEDVVEVPGSPSSCRCSSPSCRRRRRVAGVVVGLPLLPAVVRRAAEDVVEPRGRRRAVTGRSTRSNSRWED